jgi:predicted MFS family arabinose efflux permease
MEQPVLPPARERWLLFTLAGIQLTHTLDFMIMMPLGPQFTALFGITPAAFGLLVSAYTLAAGCSSILASFFIDGFGRKRVLVVLYSGFAVSTLACAYAPSYGWLMLARVAAGMFGGVLFTLAQLIIAEVVPFQRRGRAMGVLMSAFSLTSVAGVPISLWLASVWQWHAPFVMLAVLSAGLLGLAAYQLPTLDGHLHKQDAQRGALAVAQRWWQVLQAPNHRRGFAFTALNVGVGFTVIPYITIYLQNNVGVRAEQLPWMYLVGGVITFFTSRQLGRWADAKGKRWVYERLALVTMVPLMTLTTLPVVPFALVVGVSAMFFVVVSGRLVPMMALVSSAAAPAQRGTFMALNGAVQSLAMGVATFIGGNLIHTTASGQVQGYWVNGLVGSLVALLAIWVGRRMQTME